MRNPLRPSWGKPGSSAALAACFQRGLLASVVVGALSIAPLSAAPYHPPLSAYMDSDALPQDFITPTEDGGKPLAERVRVKSFQYSQLTVVDPGGEERDIGAEITASLLIDEGFELAMPGLEEAFTLVVGQGEFTAQITAREEETADPASPENFPFIAQLSSTAFPVVIRLNKEFFKPVQPGTFEPYPGPVPEPEISLGGATALTFRMTWDGETEIEFDAGGGAPPTFSLSTPVMLGDTGIVLEIGELVLDLSDLSSPAGIADPAWRGVKLDDFAVHWTNGLEVPSANVADDGSGNLGSADMAGVTFSDFFIGTGGFSGRMCGTGLGIDLPDPGLFGLDFRVDDLCLGFTRNSLSEAAIRGTVPDFPFFEADVEMTLALDMEGNFTIGLAEPDGGGLITWTVEDVLSFHIESMALEHRDGLFLVRLNGELEPLFFDDMDGVEATTADGSAPTAADVRIPVNGLTITSEGDVSLDGGWITLPQKRYIDFNAFKITMSQIGFGKTEGTTGKSWFGFTGGVNLVQGLDAEAEVKRLQFLWGGGEPVQVKLEGISVAFEQPNVLRFEGAVDWFETEGTAGAPGTKGFAGKMEIALLALNNMTIGGRVVIGSATQPSGDFKFFYIDLETQFPAGIPVFSGISIYGLSGLFSYNMSPNIAAFTSPVEWFHDYRAADNIIAGNPQPWVVRDGALALGAGVIFGTSDDGFTVNAKVALTIAVPGPTVVLSGQANVLKRRASLSDSGDVPAFVALAVFDGNSQTFLVNIGMLYSLAKVIEVSGEAEAFFNLADPGDWHLYMGQKEPESKRITATVLALTQASTYYMIEPDGLAFGSKVKYGDRWKFGPLGVRLEAWFAYDADISWRPIQAWGMIDMGGAVELKAFGVGLGLSVGADLTLETPKPFTIEGNFRVKLNLPWPLPDPKATVNLRWHNGGSQNPLDEVVPSITLQSRQRDWVFQPELASHTDANTPGSPSATVQLALLCSAGASVPEEGSLAVDVSDGCPGDGTGGRPGWPMVPLDSFLSVRFDRSMNDPSPVPGGIGLGNPYPADPEFRHLDVVQDQTFQYDATGYELLLHPKDAATVTVDTAPAGLYASWTSIPGAAALEGGGSAEADNNLDVLSKNPFRYYENVTYLGYGDEQVLWTDWAADQYATSYCLDGFVYIGAGEWVACHRVGGEP